MKRLIFLLILTLGISGAANSEFISGNPALGVGGNGGGITNDAYTAESVPDVAPTATGSDSLTAGDGATAAGATSVSMGAGADALEENSIALGAGSQAGQTGGATAERRTISLGANSAAYENGGVAIGYFAITGKNGTSVDPNNIAIGQFAKAAESGSISIGNSAGNAASGTDSIAIGNGANAQGDATIAIGPNLGTMAQASAVGIGDGATASGASSIAIGDTATGSAGNSIALGMLSIASDLSSLAFGQRAETRYSNTMSVKLSSSVGGPQKILNILDSQTTNATPLLMVGAGETNGFPVISGSAHHFDAVVMGKDASLNMGVYSFTGVIKNVSGTTSFVITPTVNVDHEDVAAWDVTVVANDTNDTLDITVTGAAATTINWVVKLEMIEL